MVDKIPIENDEVYELIQSCEVKLIEDLKEIEVYLTPLTSAFLWMERVIEHILAKAEPYYIKKGRQMERERILEKAEELSSGGTLHDDEGYIVLSPKSIQALKEGKDV